MARLGLTSEAVLVNQRGDIAGEQLTRLDPRGGGQLVTHAAGPLVLSEAAPVSLLFFIFRGSHIVSSAQGKSDMTGWPPRSVGEVVWYTASLGIAYAALTAAREAFRERPPPKQKR